MRWYSAALWLMCELCPLCPVDAGLHSVSHSRSLLQALSLSKSLSLLHPGSKYWTPAAVTLRQGSACRCQCQCLCVCVCESRLLLLTDSDDWIKVLKHLIWFEDRTFAVQISPALQIFMFYLDCFVKRPLNALLWLISATLIDDIS